jgi:hypothetical protein
MPTTIVLNDPRPRTSRITLDLTDPYTYRIRIERELVEETSDALRVMRRQRTRTIQRTITFDKQTDAPSGDPNILALLAPIQAAVLAMEAADIAAEQTAQ